MCYGLIDKYEDNVRSFKALGDINQLMTIDMLFCGELCARDQILLADSILSCLFSDSGSDKSRKSFHSKVKERFERKDHIKCEEII